MVSSPFPNRPFNLREAVWFTGQQSGNASLVAFELWIDKTGYSPTFSDGAATRRFFLNGGQVAANNARGFDFRGGGPWLILSGQTWIEHEPNGYKTVSIYADAGYDILGATSVSSAIGLPRIPKPPSIPGAPTVGTVTTTSVALSWGGPGDDGGAAVTSYTVQRATDSAFTVGVTETSFPTPAGTVTGLEPGPTYWFRVRANNAAGSSGWSGPASSTPALPAPTLTGWAQNASAALVATWTPPAITAGVIGYRLQIATDPAFTRNVQNLDTGVTLTQAVTGLTGGRVYYARIAARTNGGVNTYSTSRAAMLVLSAGDLDGWSRTGAPPAGLSTSTAEGLRRGITLAGQQAIYLESTATADVTVPADTLGMTRTMTVTPGRTYRVLASITGGYTTLGDAQARTYRLAAAGITGTAATLATPTGTTSLPPIEFVATAKTVRVAVLLATPVTATAGEDVERIAVHTIRLLQLGTDYPQRLRSTVYESSLSNHFDLACNSVGASWYVDRSGVTQFARPGRAQPIAAVFSDHRENGVLEYIDIATAYDTKTTVNRLEATNFGIGEDDLADNDTVIIERGASMSLYGTYSERLDVNLYNETPYAGSFTSRLTEILDGHDRPDVLCTSLRWNAQENIAAATALEIGQRILIRFGDTTQDSQIVALNHHLTPTRWIVTIDVLKLPE